MKTLYEKLLRRKARFAAPQGNLTVEDLWDISLGSLNTTAVYISKQLKDAGEENFIAPESDDENLLRLKDELEMVKHVIAVRLEEKATARKAVERAREREELYALLHDKEQDALKELTKEELQARIDQLK